MAWKAQPGLHFYLQFPHDLHSKLGAPLSDTTCRYSPVVLGKVLLSRVGNDSLDPFSVLNLGTILTFLNLCFHIYPVRTVEFTLLSCGNSVAGGNIHLEAPKCAECSKLLAIVFTGWKALQVLLFSALYLRSNSNPGVSGSLFNS